MSTVTGAPGVRSLPPVAAEVDAALADIDAGLDWLLALTPLGTDALWEEFVASGHTRVSPLRYAEPTLDLAAMRRRLLDLPVERIESSLLAGVLGEKQRELDRMIELVRLRGTRGFVSASIDLFGGVEPGLLELAQAILAGVDDSEPLEADIGVDAVVAAVEDEVAWYCERAPDFRLDIVVDADIGSLMMVSHGRLYLDAQLRLPHARLQPLVQHEVGTHVVTRYNGLRQPLRQLAVGLAHYDPLQEGLGVLAEYMAGYLPGERLRVLAGRVVAADMAIRDRDIPEIFACLHQEHGFPTEDAFDVAVRARRGGGLTKDAVYLRGLRDLLDHLRGGGAFEPLFAGKFALTHLVVLEQLVEAGWVLPPALLPRYATAAGFTRALDQCRDIGVEDLHHHHQPAPPAFQEPPA
ncbi:flavohemoglobin expression-modulating QEGLA motif protein [Luteimonas sp. A534]